MEKAITFIVWLIPLSLYSASAHAWGLFTHLYFAQQLIWAVPLADPRLRRIVREFPQLVMTGACLPDLAIFGRYAKTTAFDANHLWETTEKLFRDARDDRELALAIGYGSHLLVDVIAHNHFVPAHEILWLDLPTTTHIAAEWAMDAHIRPQLFTTPQVLLRREAHNLAPYVARQFGCSMEQSSVAINALATGDGWLRRGRIPQLLYQVALRVDKPLRRRFDHYIGATAGLLPQLERVLLGETPFLEAEAACRISAQALVGRHKMRQIRWRLPLPRDLFVQK
jgi:hypothetical protein